ncbi:MBL fold metallo-hydrolase [Paraurantiacibacter namhicola]|uniref:Phosphoribosyl 1,2-cyclic phosphodiesterase n=1 Tax=Paraurantiacibacter namhicola TaxID=645517 RepID=A0A1C7D912_9SPHN|nr:MBL fold metallo-hydrolase [Paraurantiacibacter namhicola]ANU07964.1 Phosphoribosyl 1,2-cyclic phosphodiesterase [Paraurantiacibacter namhicola]
MKLRVLGCGTSTGVPRIGNNWGICDPDEPKNRRTRVSIAVESKAGQRLLVDTSPDLRAQMLANEIDELDAVFWTHDHADHCHGIDDLRPLRFGRKGPIAGFGSEETVRRLRQRFGYVFAGRDGYPTIVELSTLGNLKMFAGFAVEFCEMPHGPIHSTGYRFEADGGSIGYATDFGAITDEMLYLFEDVDILVTDCLRRDPHPTHANLDQALKLIEQSGAKRAVLSHLDFSMDYATLQAEMPDHIMVGYDGMELEA